VENSSVLKNTSEEEIPAVVFDRVNLAFDESVILKDLAFTLEEGHTKIILGASGAGKSTVLKLILGLLKPDSGEIFVNGRRIDQMTEHDLMEIRSNLGMVFQVGALFESLTVRGNVGYKLFEDSSLSLDEVNDRVEEVVGFVGLAEYIERMPSELSGGQRRRVAIARAMTDKPRVLLYDEPTAGLDPITAKSINNEIVKLRDLENVSSILVTHQLRYAFYVATHTAVVQNGRVVIEQAGPLKADEAEFIMLHDASVVFEGNATEFRNSTDPYLKMFLD
jgi:phospholipid/cholesterol/gamma-HCH transport system ATP-binding protein